MKIKALFINVAWKCRETASDVISKLVECPMSRFVSFGKLIYCVTGSLSNHYQHLLQYIGAYQVQLFERSEYILQHLFFKLNNGNFALLPFVYTE